MDFGEELRRRRIASGLSLRELAVRVHYSRGYLSKVETRQAPASIELARLCDAALRAATARTFDRVDSDGCIATNDTVLRLASGAPGGAPEPAAENVLPASHTPQDYADRLCELAVPRLGYLAGREEGWWLEQVPFFDVVRERIWIFWRRLLHTAYHRAELVVYLRLAGRRVLPVYGPTADFSWQGADPTTSAEAAGRK